MRWPFACGVHELAKRDERVVLLMGDVGGGLLSGFAKDYPRRYFNLGTAEQSLVGIAAGMALQGLRPVVYTFTSFLLERAFEQVKIDIGTNRAKVLLVGYSDRTQGVTHAPTNTAKLLECLPAITARFPKDDAEAQSIVSGFDFATPTFVELR